MDRLKELWDSYGFEIVLCSCVLFIIIYAIIRWFKKSKGTWSTTYSFPLNRPLIGNEGPKKIRKDSSGEIECKRVLEKIFNLPFNKTRPDFLRNPVTGNNFNLEIDCYNPNLKLGVEYNGVQHYKYVPYFHRNNEAFLNQKYRDLIKSQFCKNEGVILIEVPYTVKVKDIESYLISELRKNGFKC